MTDPIILKKEYTLAWAIWIFLVVMAEIGRVANPWVWAGLTGIFFIIEGVGLYREKTGDTLTEHIIVFKKGGWTRIPLIIGAATWSALKVYSLLSYNPIAGAILAGGFGCWFVLHILLDAKHG